MFTTLGLVGCHDKGHEHGHADADNATSGMRLDDGKKWPTDDTLRSGMTAIRDELQNSLGAIHAKTLSADDYRALADRINTQTGKIIQGCKLPKAADEQLHLVLAQISAGTLQMRGEGDREAGAVKVIGALSAYAKHFDHPDWKPLEH